MKIVYFGILVFFLIQQKTNGAAVRKQPAFAKPVYSNYYLPAAMQVMFHAVDQLKHLEADEEPNVSTTITVPTTSPHAPGQHQPTSEEVAMQTTDSIAFVGSTASEASTAYEASPVSTAYEASTVSTTFEASIAFTDSSASEAPIAFTGSTASEASIAFTEATASPLLMAVINDDSSATTPQDTAEINAKKPEAVEEATVVLEAETPEENYATPEINHEIPEPVQETAESNQEVSEKIDDDESTSGLKAEEQPKESSENSSEEVDDNKSSSEESKENSGSKSQESSESKEGSDESKSLESSETKKEELESAEEEDDEIRFTLIGEKVAQVPRPSLSSYLRKTAKAPLRSSVQELAVLYDALSKDARKQGLAKFSGYSDEVLKTLESTVEGGVGPQLRILLEKAVERNELTRDDTKIKLSKTLNQLSDPASILNRDLRRLLPLRYVQ